jgi:HEAT repeat protein
LHGTLRVWAAAVWVGLAAGCAHRAWRTVGEGLQSENPSDRAQAALLAARTSDRSALPLLVERLEDPAADVRFCAIEALRRMTGQTLDYRYYASAQQREQAVARWRQWLKARAAATQEG